MVTTQVKVTQAHPWAAKMFNCKFEAKAIDHEPGMPIGYGKTIQEALRDFEDAWQMKFDEQPKYQWQ